MIVYRKHFPENLPDNEEVFLAHLQGVLEAIDELSHLQITKMSESYHFRIAPSIPMYTEPLLKEVLTFHNVFGIKLNLSKSIKTSGSLDFEINFH